MFKSAKNKLRLCYILLFALFLLLSSRSSSQNHRDTVIGIYNDNLSDSNISRILHYGYWYINTNADSALWIAKIVLDMTEKANKTIYRGQALRLFSNIYTIIGKYPDALEYSMNAMWLHDSLQSNIDYALDLASIGAIYGSIEDYEESNEYSFKALSILEKEKENQELIGRLYMNIASGYFLSHKYDSATIYIDKAKNFFNYLVTLSDVANFHALHGGILLKTKEDLIGIASLKTSINYYSRLYKDYGSFQPYILLSDHYLSIKSNDSALFYGKLAYQKALTSSIPLSLYFTTNNLAKNFENYENCDSVYFYLKKANEYRDSLYSLKISTKMKGLSLKLNHQNKKSIELADEKKNRKDKLKMLWWLTLTLLVICILPIFVIQFTSKFHRLALLGWSFFVFEYLSLWVDPIIEKYAYGLLLAQLLFLVVFALILAWLHDRLKFYFDRVVVPFISKKRSLIIQYFTKKAK